MHQNPLLHLVPNFGILRPIVCWVRSVITPKEGQCYGVQLGVLSDLVAMIFA